MDMGISMIDMRLLIPEITLLVVGLLLLLLELVVTKKEAIGLLGIAGTLVAFFGTYKLYALNGAQRGFSDMFIVDGYSNIFKIIFYLNVILTILISLKYTVTEKISHGEYYALLMFSTCGMMIMASAGDLIILYLGLELMALSTYILAGLMRKDRRSNEAALKYFFLGAFSSAFLLFGISITYGMTGTTNIGDIASAISGAGAADSTILYLGLIFIIVAFGFKIAMVPFHMWAPDVYEGAPTSVTAFMSVGPKAAGFAVIGRVFFEAFGPMHFQWSAILEPLAILTIAVGSIIALSQTNIKRMLAYSSIAHAGYILLGIIPGTPDGLAASVTYLVIYSFMNIGAFSVVIMLRREGFRGEELQDYMGLAKSHPVAAAAMLVFMFSLTGIPPTAGFTGKFYVIMEAINSGYVTLAVAAVLFSVVSAFFYLRVVMYMYMKEPQADIELSSPPGMRVALTVTTLMVLAIGVFPQMLLNLVKISILH